MLWTFFVIIYNFLFAAAGAVAAVFAANQVFTALPFFINILLGFSGGYFGMLLFSLLLQYDPNTDALFHNDYNTIKDTLSDKKYSHEFNVGSSLWQIFYKEFIHYHHGLYTGWQYSNLVNNISLDVYENLLVLKKKNKCRVIYDIENIKDMLCYNKILTFRYYFADIYNNNAYIDVRICGKFAEDLYDFLVVKFGENASKHILKNE